MTNQDKLKKYAFSLIELSIVLIIIGLLITGIIAGKNLISNANIMSARSLTASSPVIGTEDLALWLESTSKKSFIDSEVNAATALIGSWKDINPQSTIKKDVTQTGSARPTYIKNAINNLPALQFDGVNDSLQRPNTYGTELAQNDQITIFFVANALSPIHNGTTIHWESAVGNRINIHSPWGADSIIHWDFGNISAGGRISNTMPSSFLDNWHIISTTRRPDGYGEIRIDGSIFHSTNSMTSTLDVSNSATLYIGGIMGGYMQGYISEIIVFNRALSDFEREEIEEYLSKKWKIKLS